MTCYISLQSIFEQNSNLDKKSFNFESATCQRSKISSCDIAKKKKNRYYAFFSLFLTGDRYQRSFSLLYSKINTDASK